MEHDRITDEHLLNLASLLVNTRVEELTCEELLDRVGGYAEASATGGPAPAGSELVEQHLKLCAECREEFEALVAALRAGIR